MLFTLYMDRLESFMHNQLRHLPAAMRRSVWHLGRILPLLLFADDIALLAQSVPVMRELLGILSKFCKANKLEVNVGKSKWTWLQRPNVEQGSPVKLCYQEEELGQVKLFKYLGL